jgi:hypothetical protein
MTVAIKACCPTTETAADAILDRGQALARIEACDPTDYTAELPLPYTEADERWAAALFRAIEPTPEPFTLPHCWETPVINLLVARLYGPFAICKILEHAREHGTVECLAPVWLKDEDRPAVERLLPDVPYGEWDRQEWAGHWALGL